MELGRALEIIKTEKECVRRQDTSDCPNRDCANCDLVLPTEDVLTAYDIVIDLIEKNL